MSGAGIRRFDSAAAWAALSAEQQAEIGVAALDLACAWAAGRGLTGSDPGDRWSHRLEIAAEHAAEEAIAAFEQIADQALPLVPGHPPPFPASFGAICRGCGCIDERACVTAAGPCHWVEPDLCSACASDRPEEPDNAG